MKRTFRITYKTYSLIKTPVQRAMDDLKYMFWVKGKAPKNWKDFDGVVEFSQHQSRGGDCVEITFNDENIRWVESMMHKFQKKKNVRFVELKINNNEYLSLLDVHTIGGI